MTGIGETTSIKPAVFKHFGHHGGSNGKASASNARDPVRSLAQEDPPGERNGYFTPVFLPGESHE